MLPKPPHTALYEPPGIGVSVVRIVRRLNKPTTAWAAGGVGLVTVWNTPGIKEWVASLITQPTLQELIVLGGVLATAFLLYVCKPAGVS